MKTRLLLAEIALLVGVVFFAMPVLAYTSPGSPTGFVNDFAHVLSPIATQDIESMLVAFEASSSNEISIVTVPSMGGDYIEHYASSLFKEWGIGKKNHDNGVLLIVAIAERKVRIEVGYGLEGALPDSVAARIIANDIGPNLTSGNYDKAMQLGAQDIMAATEGEYTGAEVANKKTSTLGNIFAYLFIPIILLQWLASVFARSKSWWAGGLLGLVIGFGIATFVGLALSFTLITTLALGALGALFDFAVSNGYNAARSSGMTPPWWVGGSSGGWSSGGSGGGFGGFGGGSSGGGGASGSF